MKYVELDQNNRVFNIFEVSTEVFPTDADVIAAFTNNSLAEGHSIMNAVKTNEALMDSVYDSEAEVFVPEKPEDHPSWIWDSTELNWVAPVPKPTEIPEVATNYGDDDSEDSIANKWGWDWNEELIAWECINHADIESEEVAAEVANIQASIPKVG